jgi:hypothetical protein
MTYLNEFGGKKVTRARRDNAKLLLVACNTHDAIVAVLEQVQAALEENAQLKDSATHQAVKDVMTTVKSEAMIAEKAVAPEGTPCKTFWNSKQAYEPAPQPLL